MKRIRLLHLLMLLPVLYTCQATAQANNWTVFPSNQLNCNTAPPGSVTTLSANPVGYTFNEVEHSAFDKGKLLFSVNVDGIYDASGNNIYSWHSFSSSYTPPWEVYFDTMGIVPLAIDSRAMSEIEIFPIPQLCHNYYVMLWAKSTYNPHSAYTADLRLIQVDASSSTPTVVNDYLLANALGNWWGIVADSEKKDYSRDVYTMYDSEYYIGGSLQYTLLIKRWTFYSNGSISTGFPDPTIYPPTITPANLLPPVPVITVPNSNILELSPNGNLAYIGFGPLNTDSLVTINVHDGPSLGAYRAYGAAYLSLRGFEYVPSLNCWYVSYFDNSVPLSSSSDINCCIATGGGGIGFFPVGSSTFTKVTSSTVKMSDFAKTDLELAKNGYLYMAGEPYGHVNPYGASSLGGPLIFNQGQLAYINTNGLTSSTAATAAPTYITSPSTVNINGVVDLDIPNIAHGNAYYLQNQIDFDNCSTYYSSTSMAGGVSIDGHHITPPGVTPCHPEEVKAGLGKLTFTPALSAAEQVHIDVWPSDACGNPPAGGYTSAGLFPVIHGPLTDLDLGTATNGFLASEDAMGNYYVLNITVTNTCTGTKWIDEAVVHIKCNTDFSYSFDTRSLNVLTFTPDASIGTGPYNWEFGAGATRTATSVSGGSVQESFSSTGTQDVAFSIGNAMPLFCNTITSFCLNPVDYGPTVPYTCDADFTWTLYTDTGRSGTVSVVADNSVPVAAPGTYWNWDFGDGSPVVGGSTATHTYHPGPGTYHLCLSTGVTPHGPCKICNYICVNNSASGSGHKPTSVPQISNINETKPLEISNIYPNPASTNLNVELMSPDAKKITIKIYDVLGRLVSETNKEVIAGKQTIQLSVQNLTNGVYDISLSNGQNTIREKFVKE